MSSEKTATLLRPSKAAHADFLGLVLVTNNERDFDSIPSVTVENWAKPSKAARQS